LKRKAHKVQPLDNQPQVSPLNGKQKEYISAIWNNDIVICRGPAGTGKTYLAAAIAARALCDRQINRVVVTRPLVEADGEDIGYLPGGIEDKTAPYMRPVFDAFNEYWSPGICKSLMQQGALEIAPLAYMRGRTFVNTWVIADEMQNASREQMLMLLTRLGENSKIIITGDPRQRDRHDADGIEEAQRRISKVPGVASVSFTDKEVVRHATVRRIVEVWDD